MPPASARGGVLLLLDAADRRAVLVDVHARPLALSSFSVMRRNLPARQVEPLAADPRRRRRGRIRACRWRPSSRLAELLGDADGVLVRRLDQADDVVARRARRAPTRTLRAPPRARSRCPSARARPSTRPPGRASPAGRRARRGRRSSPRVELLERPVPEAARAPSGPRGRPCRAMPRGGSDRSVVAKPRGDRGVARIIRPSASRSSSRQPRISSRSVRSSGTSLTPSVSAPRRAACRPRSMSPRRRPRAEPVVARAVEGEDRSREVVARRRREVGDQPGELLLGAEPAERHRARDALHDLLRVLGHHRLRGHRAGRHAPSAGSRTAPTRSTARG